MSNNNLITQNRHSLRVNMCLGVFFYSIGGILLLFGGILLLSLIVDGVLGTETLDFVMLKSKKLVVNQGPISIYVRERARLHLGDNYDLRWGDLVEFTVRIGQPPEFPQSFLKVFNVGLIRSEVLNVAVLDKETGEKRAVINNPIPWGDKIYGDAEKYHDQAFKMKLPEKKGKPNLSYIFDIRYVLAVSAGGTFNNVTHDVSIPVILYPRDK